MTQILLNLRAVVAVAICFALGSGTDAWGAGKEIVYITAKSDLPFWNTLGKGIKEVVESNGYGYREMNSNLSAATQLQNAKAAIAQGVAGIVISPTDSAAAPEVLDVAMHANVPVVIADIGTNGGDYVTYVKSDNYRGAYDTGAELAQAFRERGWGAEQYTQITISLARKNGKDRTNGFRDAMKDAGMSKELLPPREMVDYSADETNRYVKDILAKSPTIRGLFIETDQPVEGALQALKAAKKTNDVLIVSFDAMPDVADLLKSGTLIAVGMQQPYLMGNKAAEALIGSLHGQPQPKQLLVPILVANNKNIVQLLPIANKTVFGRDAK
jgi:ABC-type sugar transport system substrate-binding protein